jgi:hypothetical protein
VTTVPPPTRTWKHWLGAASLEDQSLLARIHIKLGAAFGMLADERNCEALSLYSEIENPFGESIAESNLVLVAR